MNYLLACGSAAIDKYKSLFVVNASPAQRLALPAAAVNHPSRGNLLVGRVDGVVGHTGIFGCKSLILALGHSGIHKETACITLYLGVGQLSLTDADDSPT